MRLFRIAGTIYILMSDDDLINIGIAAIDDLQHIHSRSQVERID
jgi:hypothetical protein